MASESRSNMPPGPCSARTAVLDREARRAIFRHGCLASLAAGFDDLAGRRLPEPPRFVAAGGRRRVAGQRQLERMADTSPGPPPLLGPPPAPRSSLLLGPA